MKTHGTAVWQGGIKDGKGAISTKSGALKDYPYGFSSRFEGKPGTNPEQLIGAETGDERREIFDVRFNGKLLRVAITALRNFQPALVRSGVQKRKGSQRAYSVRITPHERTSLMRSGTSDLWHGAGVPLASTSRLDSPD